MNFIDFVCKVTHGRDFKNKQNMMKRFCFPGDLCRFSAVFPVEWLETLFVCSFDTAPESITIASDVHDLPFNAWTTNRRSNQ